MKVLSRAFDTWLRHRMGWIRLEELEPGKVYLWRIQWPVNHVIHYNYTVLDVAKTINNMKETFDEIPEGVWVWHNDKFSRLV